MTTHRQTSAPDNDRLVDSSLLTHAWEFAAAADAYAKADKFHSWMPLYFLIGRSMELALKAYAIHKGATEKDLRNKFGHKLDVVLAFVEAQGFALSPPLDRQDRQSVFLLNEWYSRKFLEYPLVQGYTFPQPAIMRGIVDRMIAAAFVAIWGQDQYAHDRRKNKALGLTPDPDVDWGSAPRWHDWPRVAE